MAVRDNLIRAILTKYPTAIPLVDFAIDSDGENQYITKWNLPYEKPTIEQLEEEWLGILKIQKLEGFTSICNRTIIEGFSSISTGFYFEFEINDQNNLTQQAVILINDPTITSVSWKTLNAGIQSLTREQFFTVIKESEMHKRNNISKLWTLRVRVDLATTEEELEAITWS